MDNSVVLQKFRADQHMSLRTFSARLGYAVSYISDIENNHRQVSQSLADRAKEVFEIDLHVHRFVCACGQVHA
jgi:transcriptional regulator with XRE-family HTH domain